jgi:hypothetical protein
MTQPYLSLKDVPADRIEAAIALLEDSLKANSQADLRKSLQKSTPTPNKAPALQRQAA